jgi:hypothetical protein
MSNPFDLFSPKAYLAEYFPTSISTETDGHLKFMAENVYVLEYCHDVVEIGGGPTIYQLISIAPLCGKITFCDYKQENMDEVQAWKSGEPGSYDWSSHVQRSLVYEENDHGPDAVKAREETIRRKIANFLRADVNRPDPIGEQYRNSFDLVSCHFVTDGITSNKQDWERLTDNVLSLLKPNGYIFMSFAEGGDYWVVGDDRYPECNLTRDDIVTYFTERKLNILKIATIPACAPDVPDADDGYKGYRAVVSLYAKRAALPS